ncbi:MAG TPA: ABC transporter ATP-binding protein, partial [Thermodesulfovibrionales bacterium]|nr:ABC transporter ATP-binding protein [Thermodesulfovibrionales bacterium]
MPLIEAREITKIYRLGDIDVHALVDVSTTLEKGEFVAVMGPSGSGKSTFMNVLGCLDQPTGGQYLLEGTDVGRLERDELAGIRNKKIGFVFQGFNLLSRTSALENVELPLLYDGLPARERRQRARYALKSVGLEGREDHRPNQLSGGQQQRVSISRALAGEPKMLILDEPSTGIDVVGQEDFYHLLKGMQKKMNLTILMVSHDIGTVSSYVDEISCLNINLYYHGNPLGALNENVLTSLYGKNIDLLMHTDVCDKCE